MSFLVVTLEYTVKAEHREAYLAAMEEVKANALGLGAVDYALLEDDARSNRFTEMIVYDGWVQYDRARTTPPSVAVEEIFAKMDEWLQGGSDAAEVQFRNTVLSDW